MTAEVVGAFLDGIELGMPIREAASFAGANPATVRGWIKRGRKLLATPDVEPGSHDAWCVDLADLFEASRAVGARYHLAAVKRAVEGFWVPSRPYLDTLCSPRGDVHEVTKWTPPKFIPGSLKASTWWLERVLPERFGAKPTVNVSATAGSSNDGIGLAVEHAFVDVASMTPEQLAAITTNALTEHGGLKE